MVQGKINGDRADQARPTMAKGASKYQQKLKRQGKENKKNHFRKDQ